MDSSANQEKLLALAVYEIRQLLSSYLGSQNGAAIEVRQAAHLAYALHNVALSSIEGRTADLSNTLGAIEAVDRMLGSEFSKIFGGQNEGYPFAAADVKQQMPFVSVQITRMVDPSFPGFVECAFVDALGQEHRFVEKVPVVSREDLSENTSYPRIGNIACVIEASWLETDGRSLVRVSTLHPWGVESVEGQSQFVLAASIVGYDDAV